MIFSEPTIIDTACSVSSSPLCYKNNTQPQEDFFCEWKDQDTSQNVNYTLFINSASSSYNSRFEVRGSLYRDLPVESLITTRPLEIWVQRQEGTKICTSPKFSVTLINSVKYSAVQIKNMTRSAGTLTLRWLRADNKGADHEIRWKKINASWQNETFVTEDSIKNEVTLDSYTLRLDHYSVYQVQVKRRAKQSILWSDWSHIVDIPLEVQQPIVNWTEKKLEGKRAIILSWNVPPAETALGGVIYKLTLALPCERKTKTTKNTFYKMLITYSEARVSIVAINNVGNSPSQQIIIPPVEHLKYCHTNVVSQGRRAYTNRTHCLEWYKLIDGETRPVNVHTSSSDTIEDIKKHMKEFVRYYYFLDTGRNQRRRTTFMCPIYSAEGAPIARPQNITILNETHNSVVLRWRSIPVQDQQGFMQHYVIWISKEGHREAAYHEVPANQTSFLLRNLDAGSSYTVHIAGQTKIGAGPNSTANFFTIHYGLSRRNTIILTVCAVLLLISVAFSVVIKRLRSKLLPVIPSPVISVTPSYHLNNQDMSVASEEVHNVILLYQKHSHRPNHEQSTLLRDCDLRVCEEEEDEETEAHFTDLHSADQSSSFPNIICKGKTLRLTVPQLAAEKNQREVNEEVSVLLYRDGLSLENKGLENEVTSLQVS
ncbi:hypothetical protein P4O66_012870 [Electrophorus voltai]|uniref:Fibronectin type-III domain-containing protein n=1 Tax=Electrophorus voltai TaxID=2609070 RepID=A0AAD8ZX23_9TELE|nr:hypothetical protein P4O66_012870 [Electrophorus voltai]